MKTLGALDGISLDTYDGIVLIFLEGSTEETSKGKLGVLLLGCLRVSLNILALGTDDINAL